jgi:hypothetical protein
MKIKIVLAVLVIVALATATQAATIKMNVSTLGSNGWAAFTKSSVAEPGASVTDRLGLAGADGIQFSPKKMSSSDLAFAGIGTNAWAGLTLNDFTELKITTYGIEGDGSVWTCPTFSITSQKSSTNTSALNAVFLPWLAKPATEGGSTRPAYTQAAGAWHTYDAMGPNACWYVPAYGYYYSWAGLKSARGAMYLITSGISGLSFNVGACPQTGSDAQWFSSARGVVDAFTVGVNGVSNTYDLGPVPEPGSILALATGLIGFLGLRKRF